MKFSSAGGGGGGTRLWKLTKFLIFFFKDNTTTSDVDFFDSSFTFFNDSIEVSCCASDNSLTKVICGRGTSCIGQCSAIEASLCPSGRCTGDPDDCNLSTEEERRREGGKSDATIDSQELRKCYPACKVRHIPACCFHPDCHALRPKLCNKMNYFSSKIVYFL